MSKFFRGSMVVVDVLFELQSMRIIKMGIFNHTHVLNLSLPSESYKGGRY